MKIKKLKYLSSVYLKNEKKMIVSAHGYGNYEIFYYDIFTIHFTTKERATIMLFDDSVRQWDQQTARYNILHIVNFIRKYTHARYKDIPSKLTRPGRLTKFKYHIYEKIIKDR